MKFPTAVLSEAQEANFRDLARDLARSPGCLRSEDEVFAALSGVALGNGKPLILANALRSVRRRLETFPPLGATAVVLRAR